MMAEAGEEADSLPKRGKVERVCKQWLVHEDGAMAYQMQNKEIDFHYGLNRKNRRTVREDIPVAKIIQTEEERRQQEERMMELQVLKAQAEEDEKVAQKVMQELQKEEKQSRTVRALEDEEIARQMQEKEKKKYERYLEKRKEKQLKKQREKLERELAQHTEEARLVLAAEPGNIEQLGSAMDEMNLQAAGVAAQNGHTRVTPAGRIEDDGDFSDFYVLPDHVGGSQRKQLQEIQDEELARLLQEQEHKRTKAEVDQNKLREIEAHDEQLARVIQEQEKLRARKIKMKRQQLKEQQRQQQQQAAQEAEMMGAVAAEVHDNMLPNGEPHVGHRYRRDSYTRSISNNSTPLQESPIHAPVSKQMSLPARDPPSYQAHKLLANRHAPHSARQLPSSDDISPNDITEVERWLAGTPSHSVPSDSHIKRGRRNPHEDPLPPSPSPPGSYHSEEDANRSFSPERSSNHTVSNPVHFNIAAAIDPTYRRRQHEVQHTEQTDVKMQIPLSRSLPLTEENSSTLNTLNTMSRDDDSLPEGGPVISPWQPVQGQKRATLDKSRRQKPVKKESKGSCKQQ